MKLVCITATIIALITGIITYNMGKSLPVCLFSENLSSSYFGADIPRVFNNISDRWSNHYRTKVHPLFALLTSLPTCLIQKIFNVSNYFAVNIILSLNSMILAGLLFLLIFNISNRLIDTIIYFILFCSSAGFIIWQSIPETFPFGATTLIFVLYLASNESIRSNLISHYLANIVSMSVTITNWMVGIIYSFTFLKWKKALSILLHTLAIVSVLSGVQKHIFPSSEYFLGDCNEKKYLNTNSFVSTNSRFFLQSYAPIGPIRQFNDEIKNLKIIENDFSKSSQQEKINFLFIYSLFIVLLLFGFYSFIKSNLNANFKIVFIGILSGQYILHLLYSTETFLYIMHWIPLLIVLCSFSSLTKFRRLSLILTIVLIFMGFNSNIAFRNKSLQFEQELYSSSENKTGKPAFLCLSSDNSPKKYKITAYTNGMISPCLSPYFLYHSWEINNNEFFSEITLDITNCDYNLAEGYLPVLQTYSTTKNIELSSVIFCDSIYREGSLCRAYKLTTFKNKSNNPVNINIKTNIGYDYKQQHVPHPFEQGYNLKPIQIDKDEYIKMGNTYIICENKFNKSITLPPTQSYTFATGIFFTTSNDNNFTLSALSLKDALNELNSTKKYWINKFYSFASQFRDSEDKRLMLSSLMHIIMAGPDVIYPTYYYRTPFIRDGVYITHALIMANFYDIAKKQIEYYIEKPWASSYFPEGDSLGELLFMVSDYIRNTNQIEFLKSKWPTLKECADTLVDMANSDSFKVSNTVVTEKNNEGILIGRMDSAMRYFFCNIWIIAGLREASYLADIIGDKSSEIYKSAFRSSNDSFLEFCNLNTDLLSINIRGLISGIYPTKVFSVNSPFVIEAYNKWWNGKKNHIVASEWSYFDIALTNSFFLLGANDKSEILWQSIKNKYTNWKYSIFYEGNKDMFMPHLWSAAESFFLHYHKLTAKK